jgi:hypothetical protein
MDHAIALVRSGIVGLFGLIVTALSAIEHALRSALAQAGIGGQAQSVVLVTVAVVLIVLAFRLFAQVFAVLIAVFLVLLLLNGVAPGLGR